MPDQPSTVTPSIASDAEFRAAASHALHAGAARMQRIEDQLSENTKLTQSNIAAIQAVHASTDEIVKLFEAMKGGFKVLGWLGQLAKWVAPIIGVWVALRKAGSDGHWWPFH